MFFDASGRDLSKVVVTEPTTFIANGVPDVYKATLKIPRNISVNGFQKQATFGQPYKIAKAPQISGATFFGVKYSIGGALTTTVKGKDMTDGYTIPAEKVTGEISVDYIYAVRVTVDMVGGALKTQPSTLKKVATSSNLQALAYLDTHYGDGILVPGNVIPPANHRFVRFDYVKEDGEKGEFKPGETVINKRITITAVYEPISYPVEYQFEGMEKPEGIENRTVVSQTLVSELVSRIPEILSKLGDDVIVNGTKGKLTRTIKVGGRTIEESEYTKTLINEKVEITYKFTPYRNLNVKFKSGAVGSHAKWNGVDFMEKDEHPGNDGTLSTYSDQQLTWPGHKFLGWKRANASGQPEGEFINLDNIVVREDITLIVIWEPYKIRFHTGINNEIVELEAQADGKIDISKIPQKAALETKRSNYTFDEKWGIDKQDGSDFNLNSVLDKDVDVHAKWHINKITITYDPGIAGSNAKGMPESSSEVEKNTEFTVPPTPSWEKMGVFASWKIDGSEKILKPGEKLQNLSGDIKLVAIWNHEVRIILLGGEQVGKSDKRSLTIPNKDYVDVGESIPIPSFTDKREFTGKWLYEDSEGSVKEFTFGPSGTRIERNITIYPEVSGPVKLSLDLGATGPTIKGGLERELKKGSLFADVPSWPDHGEFVGWQDSDTGVTYASDAKIPISRDMKLKALWRHKIEFVVYGKRFHIEQLHGAPINIPREVKTILEQKEKTTQKSFDQRGKKVNRFSGWTIGSTEELIDNSNLPAANDNITFVAQIDNFKLTFQTGETRFNERIYFVDNGTEKSSYTKLIGDIVDGMGKSQKRTFPLPEAYKVVGRGNPEKRIGFIRKYTDPLTGEDRTEMFFSEESINIKGITNYYNSAKNPLPVTSLSADVTLIPIFASDFPEKPISISQDVQQQEQRLRLEDETRKEIEEPIRKELEKNLQQIRESINSSPMSKGYGKTIGRRIGQQIAISLIEKMFSRFEIELNKKEWKSQRDKNQKLEELRTRKQIALKLASFLGGNIGEELGDMIEQDICKVFEIDHKKYPELKSGKSFDEFLSELNNMMEDIPENGDIFNRLIKMLRNGKMNIIQALGAYKLLKTGTIEIESKGRFNFSDLVKSLLDNDELSELNLNVVFEDIEKNGISDKVKYLLYLLSRLNYKRKKDFQRGEDLKNCMAMFGSQDWQAKAKIIEKKLNDRKPIRSKSISSVRDAIDMAREISANLINAQGQLPLAAMRRLLEAMTAFEEQQMEAIMAARNLINSGNYYTEEANDQILEKLIDTLPRDVAATFRQLLVIDDTAESIDEVMYFNSDDKKIYVSAAMIRAMFMDASGNIINKEMFEVFVRHELRHRNYSDPENALSEAIHSIDNVEEFIVSMGDIYDWIRIMGLGSGVEGEVLFGYESAIQFIMTNLAQFNTSSAIGSDEAVRQAQAQSTTYYESIQEGAIDLIAPVYYQNPEMFNARDDKKSLRIIAAGGNVSEAIGQAGVLLSRQYSVAVISNIALGTPIVDTQLYKWLGQNIVFTVPRLLPDGSLTEISLEYEAYTRDTEEGVRLINLKLKGSSNPELDTQEHFAMAVMVFAKDINTNSVFRERFSSLPGTRRMEINPSVAMIDFTDFGEDFDADALYVNEEMQRNPMTAQHLRRSDLNDVWVVKDIDLSEGNLTTIDQDIKAQEIFKLDKPEKYCEIPVTRRKLTDSKFVKRAVEVKKTQGATAIILDVVDVIDLSSQESIMMLAMAITAVHTLGLRITIKIDMAKITSDYENIFNRLFSAGFDGISLDATKVFDIIKLKTTLETLNKSSDMYSVEARNTIRLMDKETSDTLREVIGKDLEGYNTLFITDIDTGTGEVQVDEVRGRSAMRLGYERGKNLVKINIEVSASNISALLRVITTTAKDVSIRTIRQAVVGAGINQEVIKHIDRILGKTEDTEDEVAGTQKSMEAAGFIRGVVESCLVKRYMDALEVNREIFEQNAASDKEALGVLVTALFVTNTEILATVESFREFLAGAKENLLNRPGAHRTALEQKKEAIEFVNGLIEKFEEEGMVTNESDKFPALQISIAVIDEALNKIMFSKIVEAVKHRTKVSVSALTRNVLTAA
ncbi:MAG: hypothetical protein LBD17_01580 [Endomicrobium sp.]|nr:hypothetical protein [Endomicrobium sp.]